MQRVVSGFIKRRLFQPAVNLLKQGMTPEKLSATMAVGTVIGVIPAFGITTILATAVAARFRLNVAATVLIVYLVQPLQLFFILPFIRTGIFLYGMSELKLTIDDMVALFKNDQLDALNKLWLANLAGISVWAIAAAPLGFALYFILLPILRRALPKPEIVEMPVI